MISKAKSLIFKLDRQKERGSAKETYTCHVRQTHTRTIGWFQSPSSKDKVYPRSYEQDSIQPGVWTVEAKRLWEKEIQVQNWWSLQREMSSFSAFLLPQASSITHTQRACPSNFWLISWMGWLAVGTSYPYFPDLTCLWHSSLDQNKMLNLCYKNHCRICVWTENWMPYPHRNLRPKRSCKRNFSVGTSIFKNWSKSSI